MIIDINLLAGCLSSALEQGDSPRPDKLIPTVRPVSTYCNGRVWVLLDQFLTPTLTEAVYATTPDPSPTMRPSVGGNA